MPYQAKNRISGGLGLTKYLNDGLGDYVSGLGTPRDKMANAAYVDMFLSDWELMNAYRSAWLPRKIVDIPAEDSTNEGRDWQASADQIELIEAEENRLGLWQKLADVQSKARLFGGAVIYLGTGDNDPSQPLDINRIGKGGLKYITVLSRREIIAGELDRDALSPTYGKPVYYEVTGASVFARIHPSRLAIFIGNKTPDPWLVGGQNSGWGDSVLQAAYDAFKNSDATSQNIASLVFEANVDVFGVPGLMANLSDPEYARRLHERFALAATAKGINRALIRDAEEQYERKSISFATLPELMQAFLNQVAGASDIPVTRLLGQSPGGLNATGEHDMKNYSKKIRSLQKLSISPAIYNLDECLIRSALGSRPPEVFYEWSPLEQMNEKERAEIGKLNADTAKVYVETGIFTPQEIRIACKNQIVESGFYPGFDQVVEETDAGFDFGIDGESNADVQPV